MNEEAQRLLKVLNSYNIPPEQLEQGFKEFSSESKDELVREFARTFDPTLEGRVLARLPYLRTAENEADMATVFVMNLHSPDPEARASSLYGLQQLAHPSITDFALA